MTPLKCTRLPPAPTAWLESRPRGPSTLALASLLDRTSAATAAACFICADGTYSTIEASVTSDDCVACPAGFESTPIGTAEGHNEEDDCEAVDGGHRDLDDDGAEEEGDDGAEDVDDELLNDAGTIFGCQVGQVSVTGICQVQRNTEAMNWKNELWESRRCSYQIRPAAAALARNQGRKSSQHTWYRTPFTWYVKIGVRRERRGRRAGAGARLGGRRRFASSS